MKTSPGMTRSYIGGFNVTLDKSGRVFWREVYVGAVRKESRDEWYFFPESGDITRHGPHVTRRNALFCLLIQYRDKHGEPPPLKPGPGKERRSGPHHGEKHERNQDMVRRHEAGEKYSSIARSYSITPARVRQIVERHKVDEKRRRLQEILNQPSDTIIQGEDPYAS